MRMDVHRPAFVARRVVADENTPVVVVKNQPRLAVTEQLAGYTDLQGNVQSIPVDNPLGHIERQGAVSRPSVLHPFEVAARFRRLERTCVYMLQCVEEAVVQPHHTPRLKQPKPINGYRVGISRVVDGAATLLSEKSKPEVEY